MRRAERLFRLINEMRTRPICRASTLAQSLEVSISTIYRDIAHLQASGLPIDGEAGVGYMLRPGTGLPDSPFTHDQVDALAMGLSFVERTGDANLVLAAREVRAKIQAHMPDAKNRQLADAPYFSLQNKNQTQDYLALLRMAIRSRHMIDIAYQNSEGKQSQRRLHPLVIWSLTDGWMFSAWCRLRHDFRTFRLDRISSLEICAQTFTDDPQKGLKAFMAQEECNS